jgi:hypothetical protein
MKMLKILLVGLLLAATANAAVEDLGTHIRYYGTGANDNDILFTTGDMSRYDACTIMSTTGAVDVFISLDGTNYATTALSLQDLGATTTDPVLVTAALRVYGFVVKARRIVVRQNGATGANASMLCWTLGGTR